MADGEYVTKQEFQQYVQETRARQHQLEERIRRLQESLDSVLARIYDLEDHSEFGANL